MKRGKRARRRRNERLMADLISTVSHELRAPLTSIAGSLGLLVGGAAGELPSSAAMLLQIAYNNSQRLIRLVDDIFGAGKIESENAAADCESAKRRSMTWQADERKQDRAMTHDALRCIAVNGARPRVLHVDDDCDVLHIVAETLREDADVVPARSVAEARRAIAEGGIDLAMIDLALGDGDGLDLLPALRKADGKTIPTIVFSGDDTAPDLIAGVDAVLTKSSASLGRLKIILRQMALRIGRPLAADARGPGVIERRRKEVA